MGLAELATNPAAQAVAVAAAAVVGAGLYSYLTGEDASVDVTGDGEADVEFEGEGEGIGSDEGPQLPDVVISKDGLGDVKGIGGTRASALADAGFETAEDLYFATDEALEAVDGIGSYTVGQIREDIGSADDEGNA